MRIRFGIELILYFTCILPFIIFLYYSLRSCRKPVKNVYFGVKIPSEFINSEEVQEIIDRFIEKNKKYHIIALISSLPLLLEFTYTSIYMLVFMLYTFALFGFLYIPYIQTNKQLKILKKERGWTVESKKVAVADTKLHVIEDVNFNKFKEYLLLSLLVIISFTPYLIIDIESRTPAWMADVFWYSFFTTTLITITSIILPYFLFARYAFHRNYVYSNDSEVNINLNRIKKNNWKFLLTSVLIFSAVLNFFTAFLLLDGITAFWFFVSLIINTVFLMSATIVSIYKSNKLNQRINDFSQSDDFGINSLDDDSNWIWGLYYYNANDKRLFVEPIHGSHYSMTLNMATTFGKIASILTAVLMVGMFVFFIALIFDEIIPHQVDISNPNEIRISSTLYNTNFLVSDISSIEMSYEMPSRTRVNGTATNHILRGRFNTPRGTVQMFIHRNYEDFIIIETSEYIVFVNGVSPEETQSIYDEIYALWRR